MPKRIFIVEDHLGFRKALIQLLKTMREVELCGDVENAEQALASLPGAAADLVLVDLGLPGTMNGFELAVQIQKCFPQLPCVMVTSNRQPELVHHAQTLGLKGYIDKADMSDLETTICTVLAGKSCFPHYEKSTKTPRAVPLKRQ